MQDACSVPIGPWVTGSDYLARRGSCGTCQQLLFTLPVVSGSHCQVSQATHILLDSVLTPVLLDRSHHVRLA